MGRHEHITCVRSDGLSAVLEPLLADGRIAAATLVDVTSGLTLDGYTDDPAGTDLELLGASHADLLRAAGAAAGHEVTELTVSTGDGRHHVLLAVPDPHGDRLAVTVVVRGGPRHVRHARRRLSGIPVAALTDGPSLRVRPVDGTWFPPRTSTTGTPALAPPSAVVALDPAGPDPAGPEPTNPEPITPDSAGPQPPASEPAVTSGPTTTLEPVTTPEPGPAAGPIPPAAMIPTTRPAPRGEVRLG